MAAEDHARLSAEREAKRPVLVGRPAIAGLSAVESLLVGATSPQDEFGGGRPKPRFLEDAILEGEKALAERQRANAEKKQRLVEQMRSELGGKR